MTRTEELKKEIERNKKKLQGLNQNKKNHVDLAMKILDHNNLLRAELKGIQETNTKWKEAVQKLKFLLDDKIDPEINEQIDKVFKELTNQSPNKSERKKEGDSNSSIYAPSNVCLQRNLGKQVQTGSDTQSKQNGDTK